MDHRVGPSELAARIVAEGSPSPTLAALQATATEDLPPPPDLRGLRRAYTAAIAASLEAEARFVERRNARDGRKVERDTLHWQMGQAQRTELLSGRAFIDAMQAADPPCVGCGCTHYDPCYDDGGDTCGWASLNPYLCTACKGKEGVEDA